MTSKQRTILRRSLPWFFALYLFSGLVILVSTTLPTSKTGLFYLQTGQQQLLSSPGNAIQSFTKASEAFETQAEHLQNSPFLIKIISPLPPFRWYVHLGKASHSLAEAGTVAARLTASFPTVNTQSSGDLSPLLAANSNQYATWYSSHRQDIAILRNQLHATTSELDSMPSWIMFLQKSEFEAFRDQIKQTSYLLDQSDQLVSEFTQTLGSTDTSPHYWQIQITQPESQRQTYLLLEAKNGSFTALSFNKNLSKLPVEGTLFATSRILTRLTSITGSLTVSQNPAPINEVASFPTLLDTPVLAEFLYKLFMSLSTSPKNLTAVNEIFGQGFKTGELKIETRNPTLNRHIKSLTNYSVTDTIQQK